MTAKCWHAFTSAYVLGVFLDVDVIFIGSGWLKVGLTLKGRA